MKRNQPERRSNGGHGKATELGVRRGGASGGRPRGDAEEVGSPSQSP